MRAHFSNGLTFLAVALLAVVVPRDHYIAGFVEIVLLPLAALCLWAGVLFLIELPTRADR